MQQIVQFIQEVDKLKQVERKNRPLGLSRFENSAEHSWQVALLALSLERFAAEPVDIQRVIAMLLVHDLGEIDAGDVFVYATDGWAAHKEAEAAGASRIFGLLPEPQRSRCLDLWREFEEATTPEARFAHAADRAIPALLNLASNGQSWRENGIRHDQVVQRIGPPIQAGCPALWAYLADRLDQERQNGWFQTT
jgi:putative hydrolase of HD superfamily